MTKNTALAHQVMTDIEAQAFLHDQGVWIDGEAVTHPSEYNECNTSCCFAGRVALVSQRSLLFKYDEWTQEYYPSEYFTALESDSDVARTMYYTGLYQIKNNEFVKYEGQVIEAETAAFGDLGLHSDESVHLFDADNTVEDLRRYVNDFFTEQ